MATTTSAPAMGTDVLDTLHSAITLSEEIHAAFLELDAVGDKNHHYHLYWTQNGYVKNDRHLHLRELRMHAKVATALIFAGINSREEREKLSASLFALDNKIRAVLSDTARTGAYHGTLLRDQIILTGMLHMNKELAACCEKIVKALKSVREQLDEEVQVLAREARLARPRVIP